MIDSIHLKVNNITRYPGLINFLLAHSKQNSYRGETSIPKNENMQYFNLTYTTFNSSNKTLYDSKGEKLTSSHYTLGWRMPLGGKLGFCEFNFSIPKLLYGTNILQFVPHKTEHNREHSGFMFGDYQANQVETYDRLIYFIRMFFRKYFNVTDNHVKLRDIEIVRFDICWNQLFNCKRDALEYLNYQKHVKKKHLRITSKNQTGYATSVFFSTRDYGCKIYHKGSEYASPKGERRKHLEANKNILHPDYKGRKTTFDVEKLQNHADKILRYEITFRKAYLSKIYWRHCFRRNNEGWQKRMKVFRECKRIADRGFEKAERISSSLEKHAIQRFFFSVYNGRVDLKKQKNREYIALYQPLFKYIDLKLGMSKAPRDFYNWWRKQREKFVKFSLVVDEEITLNHIGKVNTVDIGNGIEQGMPFDAKFSRYLLKRCFRIFDDFRNHFEIKEKTYISDVQKKLDLYNENVRKFNAEIVPCIGVEKKPIHLSSKITNALTLLQHYSLDELVERKNISRTTAWRYEKLLKELNFNFHTGSNVSIWNCRAFNEYHMSIMLGGLHPYLKNNIFF